MITIQLHYLYKISGGIILNHKRSTLHSIFQISQITYEICVDCYFPKYIGAQDNTYVLENIKHNISLIGRINLAWLEILPYLMDIQSNLPYPGSIGPKGVVSQKNL